ncbi:hypothetical protein [Schaalia hyovaginalis]|uniref:hypothetical protein n=1 Tax=Schaalia hyovaginalis TaxID=29316 RepID=UPI0012B2EC22|nr:hypothetical protein [Schaalia hyovaginalis]MST63957.1 solute carrier organic anion transporter [Schaalia hyovaginalis]
MKYRIEPRTPSFSENMQNGLEQSAKSAALMTGGLILGGVALGVGAVRSRRIRLKLMGVAHFPISFFIVSAVLTYVAAWICDVGDPGETEAFALTIPWILLAAVILSIIWSIFFIKRYVRPKLKELDEAEYAAAAAAAASAQTGPGIIYPPGYMP